MKRPSIRSAVVCGLLALAAGAAPALAVSFNAQFFASKFNTPGTATTVMTLSSNTFCTLTGVGVEDTDIALERATCRVTRGPVVWQLDATLGSGSTDADVTCIAVCFNN